MKKIYSLLILLGLVVSVTAQTYLSEDFSSGLMPPTGWTIQNLPNQWSAAGSNQAGGVAPEGKFTYINSNTNTRLISPAINLTGVSSVTLMFSHFYDWYAVPAPTLTVATRSGGASGTWHTVWTITPTGNVGPETQVLTIANSDVGQSDFQFCYYLNGNMYNLDYWYVDNIVLFNPPVLDAALMSINIPAYVAVASSNLLTGTVKNMGTTNITSFDISYSIDGAPPSVFPITGVNLALGESYDFTDNLLLIFYNSGTYAVKVYVGNVNGSQDSVPANDTITTHVGVVPWVPVKKVYGEEATGTWCGWCVRGICYMNYMAETYPDTWIGAAVHDGDPMVDTAYDAEIPNIIPNFPGYPSGAIDRSGDFYDPQDFEAGYLSRITAISPASVDVVNFAWDSLTRVVSFDVQSEFIIDIYNELRFAAVIIEDSCWGTTTPWAQHNYYSGGGQGPMCGFESLPATIPAADMHYDHVARAILDTPYGTVGSLPSPITAGSVLHHTYTYTLPAAWRFDKLHFVGLLMDQTTGEILNANNVVFWVGGNNLNSDHQIKVYPNPFSDATNVVFRLGKTSNVSVNLYDLPGNLLYEAKPRLYPSGENTIRISGENLGSGLYILEVTVDGKMFTQKVSVVK